MDNWLQIGTGFGLAGATLIILFFVVKYFVDALKEARKDTKELTEKFITVAEKTIESQNKATQVTDQLSKMIGQVLKIK